MALRRSSRQACLPFSEVKKRPGSIKSSILRSKSETRSSKFNENLCNVENMDKTDTTPRSGRKRSVQVSLNTESVSPSKKCQISDEENSSKKNLNLTPSTYLNKLHISSPLSERTSIENNCSKVTSRKELFPNSIQEARKAFHRSVPQLLVGREKQVQKIEQFICKHLKDQSSGSLYISGLPGTGKTASVSKVLEQTKISSGFQTGYINCTSIQSSGTIYARILKSLKVSTKARTEKEYTNDINKYLSKKHKMILLVLDEIDQLATKTQSVLYTIFEWPSRKDSKIVLIGIANAMDLTDRILPRLCVQVNLKPELLHFAPYTKQEIKDILNQRLAEAGAENVFASSALELISGKVAAASGDIRKALDLSRRVLELSDNNLKSKTVKTSSELLPLSPKKNAENLPSLGTPRKSPRKISNENNGLKSPSKIPLKNFTLACSPRKSPRKLNNSPTKPTKSQPQIDTIGVMNVVRDIYGTSKTLKTDDSSYPLHQKLLICSLVLMLKKGKDKDITIGKLHQVYGKVCAKRGISAVDLSGFIFLCRQVEMSGIIRIGKGPGKLAKIILQWDESEVSNALKDQNLLSSILNDVTCL